MKSRTEVVVVGGGIIGCGVAYELARLGLTDVVLVEKTELTAGTTWHSAGQLVFLEEEPAVMKINAMSIDIYCNFQKETGEDIGLNLEGSLRLATNQRRMDRLQRLVESATALGFPNEMVGPERVKQLFPLISLDGVIGGHWSPREGRVDPSMTTQAYARLARKHGVEINRQTPVTGLKKEGGHWIVETTKGNIVANHVIVAAGFWAPNILRGLGINVPIIPAERQYIITEEIEELRDLPQQLPILRDYDAPLNYRQEGNGLLMGVHEPKSPYCFENGIPDDFGQELFPPALERGTACIEAGMKRVPKMAEVGIRRVICGPTSRTVDFNGLLGPVRGYKNLHLLSGFTAGVGQGAAVARLLAEWIVKGAPSLDIEPLHASRFGDFTTQYYIREMLGEAHTFNLLDLTKEREAGRRAMTSPLYYRHKESGALFLQRHGWERPSYFANGSEQKSAAVDRESKLIREKCGMLDRTADSKIEISGKGAAAFLQKMLNIDLRTSVGQTKCVSVKALRNEHPFSIVAACIDPNLFYLTADPEHGPLYFLLLSHEAEGVADVAARDVSTNLGILTLMGPAAAKAFPHLVPPNVDLSNIGKSHAAAMDIGYAPTRLLRYSINGLDIWEIHAAPHYLVGLDELIQRKAGVQDVGYLAFEAITREVSGSNHSSGAPSPHSVASYD